MVKKLSLVGIKSMLLILWSIPVMSQQQLAITEGVMTLGDNTSVVINNTDLLIDGDLIGNGNSVLVLKSSGTENYYIEGTGLPLLANVVLDGTYALETDIELSGNLEFRTGLLELGENTLRLEGDFINETGTCHAYSTSMGEVEKEIHLEEGERADWGGLGLAITPSETKTVLLRRGNYPQNNGKDDGIKRYYSFSEPTNLSQIEFSYWEHELNSHPEEDLSLWSQVNDTRTNNAWIEHVTSNEFPGRLSASGYTDTEQLSLFPGNENPELVFPEGFSPDNDGFNDTYAILGLQAYPDNSFTVFNQWGDIVYESIPYNNNWDGSSKEGLFVDRNHTLMDGTYFYIFYPDQESSKNVVRGFFELKTR